MKRARGKPAIAITVGDCNGIGPEIVLKSIRSRRVLAASTPILVGPVSVFMYYAKRLRIPFHPVPSMDARAHPKNGTCVVELSTTRPPGVKPGQLSRSAGAAAGEAIRMATRMAIQGAVDAIVTAPVSKRALHAAGIRFPGQTEMLKHLTRAKAVGMMLVSPYVRVGLVTIHEPLRRVPDRITRQLVIQKVRLFHAALKQDWAVRNPHLAVLGLNPHAGEGGDIGSEETRILAPAISRLRTGGIRVAGPFPADAFFATFQPGQYDAVIAMYHDQGLIPVKMTSFRNAVNVSAGLPVIRTSPDHGTAFDIAGRGTADPASMIEAILCAARIARIRRRQK